MKKTISQSIPLACNLNKSHVNRCEMFCYFEIITKKKINSQALTTINKVNFHSHTTGISFKSLTQTKKDLSDISVKF